MTLGKFRLHFKKSLSPWAAQVIIVSKKPESLSPEKQQYLVLDYHLLNESINTTHNGNNIISYYPFLSITELLARLWNCEIFSSLYLRFG